MADNFLEKHYAEYEAKRNALQALKLGKKQVSRLHRFSESTEGIELPTEFTDPFNYTPHPLCKLAADEVMCYINTHPEWHDELQQGKMFGVLVVKNSMGQLGFLAAFSGLLNKQNSLPYFVPAVYDMLNPNGHFKTEERAISLINAHIKELEAENTSSSSEEILELKKERKRRSETLQNWLFEQFVMLNSRGERKNLIEIFQGQQKQHMPPGGAGECAAPKLLQYAFLNKLQPIAMAEFWWGNSPKNEERIHGHFYPACEQKCRPILNYMLGEKDIL
jgi:tRNA pseudouridine32 synthase/23S rRNA pseudouridine746 synthase